MTTYYIIVGKSRPDVEFVVCFDYAGPWHLAIYTDPNMAANNLLTWRKEWTDTEFKLVTVDYD